MGNYSNDVESVLRKSGLTVRVVIDGGGTECPIGSHDKHVRLVTFSNRDGVWDSGIDGWADSRKGKRSPFSKPDDVLAWAKENRFIVYPVFKYDHSGVAYSIAPFSCPWDSGQAGYLLLSREEWKRRGAESDSYASATLDNFTAWCNGDVYGWIVEGEDGEQLESCWGYIGESDYALQEAIATAEHIEGRMKRKRFEKLKAMIRNRVPLFDRAALLESVHA